MTASSSPSQDDPVDVTAPHAVPPLPEISAAQAAGAPEKVPVHPAPRTPRAPRPKGTRRPAAVGAIPPKPSVPAQEAAAHFASEAPARPDVGPASPPVPEVVDDARPEALTGPPAREAHGVARGPEQASAAIALPPKPPAPGAPGTPASVKQRVPRKSKKKAKSAAASAVPEAVVLPAPVVEEAAEPSAPHPAPGAESASDAESRGQIEDLFDRASTSPTLVDTAREPLREAAVEAEVETAPEQETLAEPELKTPAQPERETPPRPELETPVELEPETPAEPERETSVEPEIESSVRPARETEAPPAPAAVPESTHEPVFETAAEPESVRAEDAASELHQLHQDELASEPVSEAGPTLTMVETVADRGAEPAMTADSGDTLDPDALPAIEADRPSAALRLRGVSKSFGETKAVDAIDLAVQPGTFYGIVGPNGAGKTTTLSMVAGLLRPDHGTIEVAGVDLAAEPARAKRLMGILPDRLRTFDRLTGRQLLHYYGVLRGLRAAVVESRVADLARAFDLTDALGRTVADYSAGMTKKVMLAGAMIHSPRVLVLDEPFEAVDPVSSAVILDILQAYVAHGGTVVLSSHGMDLVERVCSGVAVIVAGQVLAEGTIDEVRGELTLEQRFVELAGGLSDVEGLEWLHTFSG